VAARHLSGYAFRDESGAENASVSRARYNRARTLLEKFDAPEALLAYFDRSAALHEQFDASDSDTPARMLMSVCKKFNFTPPFEQDGRHRTFRPYKRETDDPEYVADTRPNVDSLNARAIEQGYRRGYDQGFAEARRLVEQGTDLKSLKLRERQLHAWRTAAVQILGSLPGSDETIEL
jgi:hypothetical protein